VSKAVQLINGGKMEIYEKIGDIKSRGDLADFVAALRSDLQMHPEQWENPTLDRFLSAMEDWIRSMDSYYKNIGKTVPQTPDWSTLANILYASKIYE
jgi:hypothetical protein